MNKKQPYVGVGLTGLTKRKRSQSCFRLDAFVVVEVAIIVDHLVGFLKGLLLVPVNALGFEDAKEVFSHCLLFTDRFMENRGFCFVWPCKRHRAADRTQQLPTAPDVKRHPPQC